MFYFRRRSCLKTRLNEQRIRNETITRGRVVFSSFGHWFSRQKQSFFEWRPISTVDDAVETADDANWSAEVRECTGRREVFYLIVATPETQPNVFGSLGCPCERFRDETLAVDLPRLCVKLLYDPSVVRFSQFGIVIERGVRNIFTVPPAGLAVFDVPWKGNGNKVDGMFAQNAATVTSVRARTTRMSLKNNNTLIKRVSPLETRRRLTEEPSVFTTAAGSDINRTRCRSTFCSGQFVLRFRTTCFKRISLIFTILFLSLKKTSLLATSVT